MHVKNDFKPHVGCFIPEITLSPVTKVACRCVEFKKHVRCRF